MDLTSTTHLLFLALAVPLALGTGRVLLAHGTPFLTDVYGREDLAASVNRLVVIGFSLLTTGFVLLLVRAGGEVRSATELLETLSVKLGVVMVLLGVVHLATISTFGSVRRRRAEERARREEAAASPGTDRVPAPGRPDAARESRDGQLHDDFHDDFHDLQG